MAATLLMGRWLLFCVHGSSFLTRLDSLLSVLLTYNMPPAGFKRSRAVWDNARRPHASRVEAFQSWSRAILYELQPVRLSNTNNAVVSPVEAGKLLLHYTQLCGRALYQFATTTIPVWAATIYRFLLARTLHQWLLVAGVLLYYVAVRYIHHVLEAGPLMIITTALVAIFTIGLGDKDENDHDGISAYSVFNRGFQRLLGSVDADQILAQHVGGAMGMGGGFMGNNGGGGGDGMIMGLQEPNVPRRRGRVVRDNGAVADPPRAAAAAAAAVNDDDDDDDDQENNNDENNDNNNNNRDGHARRPTGKKARRRNLDQRRELKRQRDAAVAMGFGTAAEVEAMQRLLDDQVVVNGVRAQDIMEAEEEEG